MATPMLRAGFLAVAFKLQEAATVMSHGDVQRRISDDLNDQSRGTGNWCYLVATFGDDSSGDCIYSCNGDLQKAPYTCSKTGAKVDMAKAVGVVPFTTYETEAPALTEAGARNSKRDMAQLQAIHDHSIGLGAACKTKESAVPPVTGPVKLVESAITFPSDFRFTEAASINPLVKIINEGRGTSGYYSREVLMRDGPKIFTPGTLMYVNHATAAEEAQRPEGDWNNLAAVTIGPAAWDDNGKDGPALYAPAKVFSDYAAQVQEKAPFTGVSIRAAGERDDTRVGPDGKPGVITALTHAESIDLVTKAGRGGKLLMEAKRFVEEAQSQQGVSEMDAAELKKLQEAQAALVESNRKLQERAIRGDAREFAGRTLKALTLHEAAKDMVVENVMRDEIPQKDGALDEAKFKEAIDAEAKRIGALLSATNGNGARVINMGGAPAQISVEETARRKQQTEDEQKRDLDTFMSLGLSESAAKAAVRGQGVAA